MKVDKLVIFGDSISTTNFSGGGYEKGLCQSLKVRSVKNLAVNAAALTAGYPYSAAYAIAGQESDPGVDCVILWAGTNDWFYGVTPTGFARSVEYCLKKIKEKYPHSKTVLVTPIWRFSERQDEESKAEADITPNSVNCTLSKYREIILNSSAENICDMNALLPIDLENNEKYLRDGVHPSRYGYDRITEILTEYIKNL